MKSNPSEERPIGGERNCYAKEASATQARKENIEGGISRLGIHTRMCYMRTCVVKGIRED